MGSKGVLRCLVEKSLALFFCYFLFVFCIFFFTLDTGHLGVQTFFSLTSALDLNGHHHLSQYWFHYYY